MMTMQKNAPLEEQLLWGSGIGAIPPVRSYQEIIDSVDKLPKNYYEPEKELNNED